MKLSICINADTRPNAGEQFHEIKDYGGGNLCGVHSIDFLTEGVIAKNRFLEGVERETILFVDIHDHIPPHIQERIEELKAEGEITRVVERPHKKEGKRWYDALYLEALREASPDATHIAHWDGDCVGYRNPNINMFNFYRGLLNEGYKYICQQATVEDHGMWWASTRFFFCEKSTLDLDEAGRLLDDVYRSHRFPNKHLPCLEHILGAMADERVLYPTYDPENYLIWSWVQYYQGTLSKLNHMPYEEIRKYVEDSGGLLGPSDLIGKPL